MGRGVNPNIVERDASGMKFLCVVRLTDRVSVAHYAHHSTPSDQIEHKISQVLLANAATIHPRLSVADKEIGTMHYETDRYAMYLAVTIADYPQRIAFKCLAELKERWADAFGEVLHKAEQGGLSKAAKPVMTELCTKYADAGSIDKTLGLIREVDSVKGIVSETVHRLLNTHENLEVLEDRSEQLKAQTQTFQKVARETKNIQKKKNNKLCRIFCCVILFGIVGAGLPLAITASSPSKTLRLCCVPCYVPCCVPCCSVRGAVLLSPYLDPPTSFTRVLIVARNWSFAQNWDTIKAFLLSMFPPEEPGSGDFGSGSGEWDCGNWTNGTDWRLGNVDLSNYTGNWSCAQYVRDSTPDDDWFDFFEWRFPWSSGATGFGR
jgi:vesicle-associated membrane protein 7